MNYTYYYAWCPSWRPNFLAYNEINWEDLGVWNNLISGNAQGVMTNLFDCYIEPSADPLDTSRIRRWTDYIDYAISSADNVRLLRQTWHCRTHPTNRLDILRRLDAIETRCRNKTNELYEQRLILYHPNGREASYYANQPNFIAAPETAPRFNNSVRLYTPRVVYDRSPTHTAWYTSTNE